MKLRVNLLVAALLSAVVCTADPSQRLVGGDISLIPAYEAANTPYYDRNGNKINDLVTYLATECHWNACRIRLFVNPVIINADGTHQGEVQDLAYVTALAKRAKDAGMAFLLDFHYSDTWADPSRQTIPAAWQTINGEGRLVTEDQLADTLYGYTTECLRALAAAGAAPDYVQIGNEITCGILWRSQSEKVNAAQSYSANQTNWHRFAKYLKSGAKAVRDVCPDAKVMLHIERIQLTAACLAFFNNLAKDTVDYDVIGLSYYPFWHGWLDKELCGTLNAFEANFPDKPIHIVETAYYNNYFPSSKYNTAEVWPATEAGQDAFLADMITEVRQHPNVQAIYYWFPEENGNGGASYNANNLVITSWLNRGLFNPQTHRALKGLYRLSDYLSDETALDDIRVPFRSDVIWSVTGQPLGTDLSALQAGVYIRNGQVILK